MPETFAEFFEITRLSRLLALYYGEDALDMLNRIAFTFYMTPEAFSAPIGDKPSLLNALEWEMTGLDASIEEIGNGATFENRLTRYKTGYIKSLTDILNEE